LDVRLQKQPPRLSYHYHQDEVIYEEYQGTYADKDAAIKSREYGWNHGLGEVITALTEAGLQIEFLREHDESPYDMLPYLVQSDSGMYRLRDQLYPLIFEIKARKA
jgi:hypothetical protein